MYIDVQNRMKTWKNLDDNYAYIIDGLRLKFINNDFAKVDRKLTRTAKTS